MYGRLRSLYRRSLDLRDQNQVRVSYPISYDFGKSHAKCRNGSTFIFNKDFHGLDIETSFICIITLMKRKMSFSWMQYVTCSVANME